MWCDLSGCGNAELPEQRITVFRESRLLCFAEYVPCPVFVVAGNRKPLMCGHDARHIIANWSDRAILEIYDAPEIDIRWIVVAMHNCARESAHRFEILGEETLNSVCIFWQFIEKLL